MSKNPRLIRITLRLLGCVIIILIFFSSDTLSEELYKDTNLKIILAGFDGLEWSIVRKLIQEGKMPTFASLIQEGTSGELLSYHPVHFPWPVSPALWTTIATGKSPQAHGIWGFIIHEKDSYKPVPYRSYHRKAKAIWNILSEQGKKVGVINYFASWPPEEVNGFIVSRTINEGRGLSNLKDSDVFPPSLANEVRSIIKNSTNGKYKAIHNNFFRRQSRDISRFLNELSILSSHLYQNFNQDLDLLMTYVKETDYAQHFFWKFMEPEFFQHPAWGLTQENVERYGNFIYQVYQRVDSMVEELIRDIDEDTIVIICSDHGFQRTNLPPQVSLTNLDGLLEALGFLRYLEGLNPGQIDFSRTQAYHYEIDEYRTHYTLISINLKARQSEGIVEPAEYSKLKSRLIGILGALEVAETGKKLFNKVYEVSFEDADIGILIRDDIDLLHQHLDINGRLYPLSRFCTFENHSGRHRSEGVLIISGKHIKRGNSVRAHILDITPTILYLLGLPVARDMEGRVLIEAIEEGFLKENPIRYIDSYEATEKTIQAEGRGPEPIDEESLERLKSLGYVH
jgi:predicted AlkP superfamily phosphohydrolase/phosphomutase